MAVNELGVWLRGDFVASIRSKRPGRIDCRYSETTLTAVPANSPLLSCSLPLRKGKQDGSVFFSGLLPEGQHLQAMASQAGLATNDVLGLLRRYGRDVAGAVVLSNEPPAERLGGAQLYSGTGLEDEIDGLPDRPLAIYDDSELSIAGLQNKLLLIRMPDGQWARPTGGRASTHILKVEDLRYPGMAEAEAGCLRLAKAIGLTTVDVAVESLAGRSCVIVSRFDRIAAADGAVVRVHQEDACQALGRNPDRDRGAGKYERSGGPTLREVALLLDTYAAKPSRELARLTEAMTFTFLIGNADAHGKNISFLHSDARSIELSPLYDTVPTMLWPKLRTEMAMSINGKKHSQVVRLGDLVAEASSWLVGKTQVTSIVHDTIERTLAAVGGTELPSALVDGIRSQADTLVRD